jgi:hypothetical protein
MPKTHLCVSFGPVVAATNNPVPVDLFSGGDNGTLYQWREALCVRSFAAIVPSRGLGGDSVAAVPGAPAEGRVLSPVFDVYIYIYKLPVSLNNQCISTYWSLCYPGFTIYIFLYFIPPT